MPPMKTWMEIVDDSDPEDLFRPGNIRIIFEHVPDETWDCDPPRLVYANENWWKPGFRNNFTVIEMNEAAETMRPKPKTCICNRTFTQFRCCPGGIDDVGTAAWRVQLKVEIDGELMLDESNPCSTPHDEDKCRTSLNTEYECLRFLIEKSGGIVDLISGGPPHRAIREVYYLPYFTQTNTNLTAGPCLPLMRSDSGEATPENPYLFMEFSGLYYSVTHSCPGDKLAIYLSIGWKTSKFDFDDPDRPIVDAYMEVANVTYYSVDDSPDCSQPVMMYIESSSPSVVDGNIIEIGTYTSHCEPCGADRPDCDDPDEPRPNRYTDAPCKIKVPQYIEISPVA